MEKKIVVSKRFRNNTLQTYNYIQKEFSSKVAFEFLDKLQERIEFIIRYPEAGKPSQKNPVIRSITLQPHNRIYYRINNYRIDLLCLFDMRKKNKPY